MNILKYTCLLLLMLLLVFPLTAQVDYNTDRPIEITLDGITTVIYPDRRQPLTHFHYVPGTLYLHRNETGGKSRLQFSLEAKPDENGARTDRFLVQCTIDARYGPAYERRLAKKLMEMGHVAIDPLWPAAAYHAVQLNPVPLAVKKVDFANAFDSASWLDDDTTQVYSLVRPFPLRFEVNRTDATLLVESLLRKRGARLGGISTTTGLYLPLLIGLEFKPGYVPLRITKTPKRKSLALQISNPTEHAVRLRGIRYFTPGDQEEKYLAYEHLLPPWRDEQDAAILNLELPEKAMEIVPAWDVPYDLSYALEYYLNNTTPAGNTKVYLLSKNIERTTIGWIRTLTTDILGLTYRDSFALAEADGRPKGWIDVKGGFGGINKLNYQVGFSDKQYTFYGPWQKVDRAMPGTLSLDLTQLNSSFLRREPGLDMIPTDDLRSLFLIADAARKTAWLPATWTIATTAGGRQRVEIDRIEESVRWLLDVIAAADYDELVALHKRESDATAATLLDATSYLIIGKEEYPLNAEVTGANRLRLSAVFAVGTNQKLETNLNGGNLSLSLRIRWRVLGNETEQISEINLKN
jgi:hypothetical protein